jgi:hypothetical protein
MAGQEEREDKRAAANIAASLSSYLMTASLGMIAAQAVIVTFVLEKRQNLLAFSIVSIAGFLVFVLSLYFGGRGIHEVYKDGFRGNWKVETSRGGFDRQSKCSLLGVLLVVASLFLGTPKSETSITAADWNTAKATLSALQKEVSDLKTQFATLRVRRDDQDRSQSGQTQSKTKHKR